MLRRGAGFAVRQGRYCAAPPPHPCVADPAYPYVTTYDAVTQGHVPWQSLFAIRVAPPPHAVVEHVLSVVEPGSLSPDDVHEIIKYLAQRVLDDPSWYSHARTAATDLVARCTGTSSLLTSAVVNLCLAARDAEGALATLQATQEYHVQAFPWLLIPDRPDSAQLAAMQWFRQKRRAGYLAYSLAVHGMLLFSLSRNDAALFWNVVHCTTTVVPK
eukprot:Sspe_Gene.77303::Locus_48289_Transcript_1_1_Confidence_1.000_Length_689::g.77303::m.77303